MAQAVIIDVAIAALLILFTIFGAQRGLLKSVAGLVILLVSLVGALLVSNLVTPFISEAVQPMVMETVESKLEELSEKIAEESAGKEGLDLGKIDLSGIDLSGIQIGGLDLGSLDLSKLDLSGIDLKNLDLSSIPLPEVNRSSPGEQTDPREQIDELLGQLGIDPALTAGLADAVVEQARATGASVIEALVRVVVETVVHAVVFLLAFVVLNILLRIVLAAMGLVLMLPGLRTLNSLGGAVVAFVECALLLFLLVWIGRQCAVDVTGLSRGTVLLQFFVNNTPLSVLALL